MLIDVENIRKLLVDIAPTRGQVNAILRARPTEDGSLAKFGSLDARWIMTTPRAFETLEEYVLAEHAPHCFLDLLKRVLVCRRRKTRQKYIQGVVKPSWHLFS